MKEITTATELAQRVSELVSLPAVYLQVREIVGDPDSSMMDLARAISGDPGTTARILRVVNSACYCFTRTIDTVSHAVSILGMQQVHDLALASSVASVFEGVPSAHIDVQRFWKDSVTCALAARNIATEVGLVDVERLFVEGLLCRIGHLVMCQGAPALMAEVLARTALSSPRIAALEQELLGFSYASVGAEFLRLWNLPDALVRCTAEHVEPDAGVDGALEAAIVHTANHIANGLATGEALEERLEQASPSARALLKTEDETLLAIANKTCTDASLLIEIYFPSYAKST